MKEEFCRVFFVGIETEINQSYRPSFANRKFCLACMTGYSRFYRLLEDKSLKISSLRLLESNKHDFFHEKDAYKAMRVAKNAGTATLSA